MKNFKDWTKGQKVGCGIAIVIVILLVIWGCVALNKNDTTETISAEVETSESVSSELVADVETLESTEAVVETEATTEVPGTEAVESEVIESTEASVETEELQTEEVEVLSEAVPSNTPGDTVISTAANSVKPVSGRPYLKYDEAGYIDYYGSWTTGKTWTASNGVVLKINDFGQEVDVSNPSNRFINPPLK